MQLENIIKQRPNSQLTIGVKKLNPIDNSTIDNRGSKSTVIVDQMLIDYQDLIEPSYKKWFASKFYNIPFDQLHRAASEARQDGKNSKRFFAFLVKKLAADHS
jgi:hypothetical protein